MSFHDFFTTTFLRHPLVVPPSTKINSGLSSSSQDLRSSSGTKLPQSLKDSLAYVNPFVSESVIKKINPKILPGKLHKENKGAIDWGLQNLLAYGCFNYVVIFDPSSSSTIQVLDEHLFRVVRVRWSNENLSYQENQPFVLSLASADFAGNVFIWNVLEGTVRTTFSVPELQKPVIELRWAPREPNVLLVLYESSPNILIAWDTLTQSRLWRYDLGMDDLLGFEFNHFDSSSMFLSSRSGYILTLADFSAKSPPQNTELRCRVSPKENHANEPVSLLQMKFSPSTNNVVFLVLPREILKFDISFQQVIGSVLIDRSKPAFCEISLYWEEPDRIYCLHEDQSLSVWDSDSRHGIPFQQVGFCEPFRFHKHIFKKKGFVFGLLNSPQKKHHLAALTHDGVIWQWEIQDKRSNKVLSLKEKEFLKIIISGQTEGVSSAISSLCVSPFSEHILAFGTFMGTIQIVESTSLTTKAEFSVRNSEPVRGLRWLSKTSVIFFSSQETTKGMYKNILSILDLKTGKLTDIRQTSAPENTFIRAVRISSGFQYFILLLKERPFELWDVKTLKLVTIGKLPQITALEWAPLEKSDLQDVAEGKNVQEQFIFTLPDGSIHFYTINRRTMIMSPLQVELSTGIISSIAWKDQYLVSGDTVGTIHCWNLIERKSTVFTTNKGLVKRIKFAPGDDDVHLIIVMFQEGDFGIWDLDHSVRIANSNYLVGRDLRAIDLDWASDSNPVVATSDGCIRILDRSLCICSSKQFFRAEATTTATPPSSTSSSSSSSFSTTTASCSKKSLLYTPFLLAPRNAILLKVFLQHGFGEVFKPLANNINKSVAVSVDDEDYELVTRKLISYVDPNVIDKIRTSRSKVEQCYHVCKFFGNEEEMQFWAILLDYIKNPRTSSDSSIRSASGLITPLSKGSLPPADVLASTLAGVQLTDHSSPSSSPPSSSPSPSPSSSSSSSLSSEEQFPVKSNILLSREKLIQQEKKKETYLMSSSAKEEYDVVKRVAEFNLLLGEKQKAMDLLLSTPITHPNSYADSLMAITIAASMSPETYKDTVYGVAIRMMESGSLGEGTQLLCTIGRHEDAARLLQSAGRWSDAAWLAKLCLPWAQCSAILTTWVEHLLRSNHTMPAIFLIVMQGKMEWAVKELIKAKQVELAALFASICYELKLFSTNDSSVLGETVQPAYVKYGQYLFDIGCHEGASYYWALAESISTETRPSTPQKPLPSEPSSELEAEKTSSS